MFRPVSFFFSRPLCAHRITKYRAPDLTNVALGEQLPMRTVTVSGAEKLGIARRSTRSFQRVSLPGAGPAEPAICLMPVALHEQSLASSPVDVENAAPARIAEMPEAAHAGTRTGYASEGTDERKESGLFSGIQELGVGCADCETVCGLLTVDGSKSWSGQNESEFDGNVHSVEDSIVACSVMSALLVVTEPQGTNRRSRRAARKSKSEREEERRSLSSEMSQSYARRACLLAKQRENQRDLQRCKKLSARTRSSALRKLSMPPSLVWSTVLVLDCVAAVPGGV